jgi:hypothetical protein
MKRGRHLDGDEGLWSTLMISFDGLEKGNASMRAESGERRAESGNLESGELHLRHELRGEMHL